MIAEAPPEVMPPLTSSNLKLDRGQELALMEGTRQLQNTVRDLSLAADDLIIPWSELVLKEKIGSGTGVHRT
jgi:serine/threonine-protein kinase CTR1